MKYYNKKTVIDAETGEVIRENNWIGYDGFVADGYKYRNKVPHMRLFLDDVPSNLSEEAFLLLIMIAELTNNDNVLVRKVERKSKFSSITFYPLDKEEIREMTRFRYGINKFDRCWKELNKKCIKKVRYHQYLVWCVNPAITYKNRCVPFWLYSDWKSDMNTRLSARSINKMNEKLKDLGIEN